MSVSNSLQKAWEDLGRAEQSQQDAFEKQLKETVQILIDLANALRHEALENLRRTDPDAPYNWNYLDWRKFWFEEQRLVSQDIRMGWGQISLEEAMVRPDVLGVSSYNMLDVFRALKNVERTDAQKIDLEQLDEVFRKELREKQQEIDELSRNLDITENLLRTRKQSSIPSAEESVRTTFGPKHTASTEIQVAKEDNLVPESLFERELALLSKIMPQDQLPPHWRHLYQRTQAENRIIKIYEILFAMYSCGISCRHEVEWFVQSLSGISVNNRSIRRCFQDLKTEEIIDVYYLELKEATITTTTVFLRLTGKGRQLCQDWKLPELASGSKFEEAMARGLDLDAPLNQLVVVFSFYASMRKWDYEYCPDNQADLIVFRGDQKYAVVVFPENANNDAINEKIQNLHSQGEKVAFVTISTERALGIADWHKKQKIPGAYTSIKYLIDKKPETKEIVPFTFEDYIEGTLPLWAEEWD